MKRFIIAAVAAILVLSLLPGCGKTERPGDVTESAAESIEQIAPENAEGKLPEEEPDPLIWRVTKDNETKLYLFGTMHIGDERSEHVLSVVEPILSECGALAVEFDTVAYAKDAARSTQDIMKFIYSDGTTVKDHVSVELYEKMTGVLKEADMYFPLLDQYNTAMWGQLLNEAYVEKSDLSSEFAEDELLIERAYSLGIPVYDVESASFQFDLINSLPEEYNILSIEEAVSVSFEESSENLGKMYEVWLEGDEEALLEILSEEDGGLSDEDAELVEEANRKMLTERNLGMAQKAVGYIESGETVFFAVGTAHMIGDGGLVELLTAEGYTVERIHPGK